MEAIAIALFFFLMIYGICLYVQFICFYITGKTLSLKNLYNKIRRRFLFNKYNAAYDKILNNHSFFYYQNLDKEHKIKFLYRVLDFIIAKDFIPCKIPEVNLEQKVLISASAIQLTFGLDKYLISDFSRILVYPSQYYSGLRKEQYKGDVNLMGTISLSYDNFIQGYNDSSDGINLGLHEMAHALKFDRLQNQESNDFFYNYFDKWQQSANIEFEHVREHKQSFYRDYARANKNEFFAVCIENFFERPLLFKTNFPELYDRLTILLNQDPLNNNTFIESPRLIRSSLLSRDVTPVNMQYVTRFPINDWIFKTILSFIFFCYWMYLCSDNMILLFVIISLFIFYRLTSLFQYRKFSIYENCLVIQPFLMLKSRNVIYEYQNIISISNIENTFEILTIKYIVNGKIKLRRYKWPLNKAELDIFMDQLRKLNVVVMKAR
jgi:MtfA peptidase